MRNLKKIVLALCLLALLPFSAGAQTAAPAYTDAYGVLRSAQAVYCLNLAGQYTSCGGGAAGAGLGVDAVVSTYSQTATGTTAPILTTGYGTIVVDLTGTFSATVNGEFASDASADCQTGGTWVTGIGQAPSEAGNNPNGASLTSALRRREYRAQDGLCFRLNVTAYTSGTVASVVAKRIAPVGERSVYVGGGLLNPTAVAAGTNRSATVAATAANLMAANTTRRGLWVKNDSGVDIWCNFDGAAVAAAGSGNFKIAPNGYFASEPSFVSSNALSCITGSGTAAITAREH